MSNEKLVDLTDKRIEELSEDVDSIVSQLEQFKIDEKAGRDVDYAWRKTARFTLRTKRRKLQSLKEVRGKARREAKREFGKSVDRAFIQLARQRLPSDTFNSIMEEAHRVAEAS